MPNFQLAPGDKYDGRCAEIYITEKLFLVYHCSVCEEIYTEFNELLSHLNKEHYENAMEYQNEKVKGTVEINDIDVTATLRYLDREGDKYLKRLTNSEELFIAKVDDNDKVNQMEVKEKSKFNSVISDINALKGSQENEDPQCPLNTSKITPQREKLRASTGIVKNHLTNRTKLKSTCRYQQNPSVDSEYVCGICGFAFKKRTNLRSHQLRHSNQKNFSCSLCSNKFFTKVELKQHEYRHKEVRPLVCNHCGKVFVYKETLNQHNIKTHSLNRPFTCNECNKAFLNGHQLEKHPVAQSDEHSFQNTDCLASFKVKKCLTSHIIIPDKIKLRCKYCDFGFSSELALKTHQSQKHDHDDLENCVENDISRANADILNGN